MTATEMEARLMQLADRAADLRQCEIEDRERRVSELARRISGLDNSADVNAHVARLEAEQAQLAETIVRLERQAAQVSENLLARARAGLALLRAGECRQVLADAEALFDELAAGELHEAAFASSPALLEADLARCRLADFLQERFVSDVVSCCRELAQGREAMERLRAARHDLAAESGRLEEASIRLAAHGVPPEVLRSLELIEEPDWFLEDVMDPYTRAAVAESRWRLPRNVFKELGYGG